ncbi:MAG TPA: ATP-binding cassette domain-containing protein [Acidimicrobiales bacterium]|nr:ATP-binding cassette domain-containing protein [Acidimicrobiales bacterium]
MSLATLVLGLLNGLTIGLLAVGLVLVYKSNRFLNLAHAQLGTLSALLLEKWVLDVHWNWWVAFLVAIAVGVATGGVVERFMVAPLRRRGSSPVRLLLVSLAASQVLLALTYIPALNPDPSRASVYPQPFASHAQFGGVLFTGSWVLTAILVPLLVIALAAFMRYSVMGKQIRAAANNPDAARLCGISVNRVSTVTWLIAGGLSAISAVLQAPTQSNFNVAALGPYLLMVTLGAAAFGAFVSLPAALGGGIILGLISQIVGATTSNGTDGELAVFGAVMLILFIRGRAIGRVFAVSGVVVEHRPVLRVPKVLRSSPLVRSQWAVLGAIALVLAIVWPQLPYFHTVGHEFTLSLVLVYAVLGVALTVLLGWGGQVSLGHFAVVGLGAYLMARWAAHNWSLPALLIVVGVVCAGVMVVVGLPALRVPGLTLAVTTLGFAVIADDWLFHQSWFGSAQAYGTTLSPPSWGPKLGTPSSPLSIYYVALVVLVLAVATCAALRRSMPGRAIIAVRDNERASAAFGLTPASVKLATLAVSGFFAGAAGVLWADAWKSVAASQFPADLSLGLIAIPVIGGLGSLGGAVAAAVLLYAVTFFAGPSLSSLFGSFGQSLAFGLLLGGVGQLAVLLQVPTGISGAALGVWQRILDRRARVTAPEVPEVPGAPEVPEVPGAPEVAPVVLARSAPAVAATEQAAEGALALEVEGVRVHFGGVLALDEPDICVRAGEIVGLIGTNGAGKTTLMNVISGLQSPDGGSVKIFGHEVADLAPDFRAAYGVARSFQDASLFPGLTVTETIEVALGRRNRVGTLSAMLAAPWVRTNERQLLREARAIVERFGLGAWADSQVSELSTGTRRICDLAAQVATVPKLLLLDEPTAGVAQREAEAFGPLVKDIREELDCAILIVEHDMPLLMGLCDRMYALEAGAVIGEGSPEEIRHNPRVVASYLGTEEAAIIRSGSAEVLSAGARGGY